MKVEIAICCNKDYKLLQSDCLVPMQAGKACAKTDLKMRGDDTGDNISKSNKYYGEGTVLYWMWKNSKADILGVMQYRRYLNLKNNVDIFLKKSVLTQKDKSSEISKKYGITSSNIEHLLSTYDIITRHKENINSFFYGNVEEQYKGNHTSWVWDETLKLIKIKNNDFYKFILKAEKGYEMYFKNMFIARKALFDEICENTLSITEKLKNVIDLSWPEFNKGCRSCSRVLGFILERLIGLYLLYLENRKKKILECGTIDILEESQKSTEQDENVSRDLLKIQNDEIIPLKSQNVVVMGCNDSYIGPCSVTVESILENSDVKNCPFEFVFLFNSISEENLRLIKKTISNKLPAQFYDISSYLNTYSKYFNNLNNASVLAHCSLDSYLRLFIPLLFKKYKKALWLDCDVIVNHDLNDLFSAPLEQNWLAAVQDPYITTVSYSFRDDKEVENIRNHLKKDLKLSDYSSYFNAGVILFNMLQCNKDDVIFRIKNIIESSLNAKYIDQDVLNYLCGGQHVKWLSMYWNVAGNNTFDWTKFSNFSKYKQTSYAQSDPYIFHYSGWCKPWKHPTMPNAYLFWQYARNTPFYEKLLFSSTHTINNSSSHLIESNNQYQKKFRRFIISKIRKYHFLNNLTFHVIHKFKNREKKYNTLLRNLK